MAGQRSRLGLDGVGHVVEIVLHGSGVHVVEDGAGSTWRAIDDRGERLKLDQRIELVLALSWHVEGKHPVLETVGDIGRGRQIVDGIGHQVGRDKVWRTGTVDYRHAGVYPLEQVKLRNLHPLS